MAITHRRLVWAAATVLALSGLLLLSVGLGGAEGAPGGTAVDVSTSATSNSPIVPSRFRDEVVIGHLDEPTAVAFATNGQVFVAQKDGIIKVFAGLDDPTGTVFADLNTDVMNMWDRGMLGLALSPDYPADPSVYVMYAYDHLPGSSAPAPAWGTPGQYYDDCAAAESGGCAGEARVVRLTAGGADLDHMVGDQQVLADDYCYQFPSHGSGSLAFGPDGYLYASSGEGASYNDVDYGQLDDPCSDPPREGGSLRAQDLRTSADPTVLDGSVIRIDPTTGAAAPDNPLASSSDVQARKIVAEGLRNPFRLTVQPGTGDVYVGDVGNNAFEEIDRIPAGSPTYQNFGWPCYEGTPRNPGFDVLDLPICEGLYQATGSAKIVKPTFAYATRGGELTEGEQCHAGSSSISGLAFVPESSNWPDPLRGALLFSDYSRGCIWSMQTDADGRPDPTTLAPLVQNADSPVDLVAAPDGQLYYVDLGVDALGYPHPDAGSIHRIAYYPGDQPPSAALSASATYGELPFSLDFDASASTDPDSSNLTYAWDLDGDGVFDDAVGPVLHETYTEAVNQVVEVEVSDETGAMSRASITVYPGDSPPTITVLDPTPTSNWQVGDNVHLLASATDAEDGELPATSMQWSLAIHHCPSSCHTHPVDRWVGQAEAWFIAPDHEYPSTLLLSASATDSRGLTATTSFEFSPRPQQVRVAAAVLGKNGKRPSKKLSLVVAGTQHRAPFTRTFITNGSATLAAPATQRIGRKTYRFVRWSDHGDRVHPVTIPARERTWTAVYRVLKSAR